MGQMASVKSAPPAARAGLAGTSIAAMLLFLLPAMPAAAVNGSPACGALSDDGYHQISNQAQLAAVGSGAVAGGAECRLDAKYRLMNDITLVGEWTPLPGVPEFSGELDGNNRIVRNLVITKGHNETISGATYTFGGLFSRTKGAWIHDLTLEGASITISSEHETYAGSLAGVANYQDGVFLNNPLRSRIDRVTVKNSSVSVETRSANFVGAYTGGVIGYAATITMNDVLVVSTQVSSSSEVTGSPLEYAYAGGVAGSLFDANVQKLLVVCSDISAYSAGDNQFSAIAGGLFGEALGYVNGISINGRVFGDGTVRAASPGFAAAGGLTGYLFSNSGGGGVYESGVYGMNVEVEQVNSDANHAHVAGGLVGLLERGYVSLSLVRDTAVTGSYLRAASPSNLRVGGLVGQSQGSLDNTYVSGGSVSGVVTGAVSSRIGGYVGYTEGSDTRLSVIDNSYVRQTSAPIGGEFIGQEGAHSRIKSSFFQDDVSGLEVYPGEPPPASFPVGLTQEAMRSLATYSVPADNWYFSTEEPPDWGWGLSAPINDGFPYLYWEVDPSLSTVGCSSDCAELCDEPDTSDMAPAALRSEPAAQLRARSGGTLEEQSESFQVTVTQEQPAGSEEALNASSETVEEFEAISEVAPGGLGRIILGVAGVALVASLLLFSRRLFGA